MRILLIDGDIRSKSRLRNEIQEHYLVDVAFGGSEGDYMAQVNDYAAIVVDSNLRDMDNAKFCERARNNEILSPILVLLDAEQKSLRLDYLDCGADLVLTKPVEIEEVKAYLRILTSRNYGKPGLNKLVVGDLGLDIKTKRAVRGGKEIKLRRKEYEILEYLMINKNNIVSKEMLLEHIWDCGLETRSNTLEVQVKNLRDKIDRPYKTSLIKTVRGFGYKICP